MKKHSFVLANNSSSILQEGYVRVRSYITCEDPWILDQVIQVGQELKVEFDYDGPPMFLISCIQVEGGERIAATGKYKKNVKNGDRLVFI